MNKILTRNVPLTKHEMKYKFGNYYSFKEWIKNDKLVLLDEDTISFKILESTWTYTDEFNPKEIYGYSYTLELGDIAIATTEVFPTFTQALKIFKQIILEEHKDLLEI